MIKFYAHKMLQTAEGKLPFDVSFQLEQGKFLSVYGNSGAGKTTLLRILAGLSTADSSNIVVGENTWDDSDNKIHLSTQKRKIGFVFQDFALFPNFTVKENLEYALQKGDDKKVITELIEIMELQSLQNSKPQHISGGQKQRVALARAIVRKPAILLLDEPLSALDNEMRNKLQDYILKIHTHYNLTTIMVSHYLPEIYKLSDSVIVLEKGKIKSQGTPSEVFGGSKISNKFKITGEILSVEKSDVVYIVSILAGNDVVKVIAVESEITELKIGSKVLLSSKAFNPLIQIIK